MTIKKDMAYWYIFCDGGSRNNPGNAASGFVIYRTDFAYDGDVSRLKEYCTDQSEIVKKGVYLGIKTNNEAEWLSLYYAYIELQQCRLQVGDVVYVFMDSNLVINQVQKKWKINEQRLRDIFISVRELQQNIELALQNDIHYYHIYRSFNTIADEQVNHALDNL